MSDLEFKIGDKVQKRKGYRFPGVIIGHFQKLDGSIRYAVECVAHEAEGIIHIYSTKDLEERTNDQP